MRYLILAIFLSGFLFAAGCKKTTSDNVTGGGKGGNATLIITPQHGGVFIDSCTVYIKYGTDNAPANGLYDDSAVCAVADTTPIAAFTNLTNGMYYLFGKGYHTTYSPPYLKGGLSITISRQDTIKTYLQLGSYTSW
jgi:hypothetical protein